MMEQFLNGSVFYPCSGLDGAPIKYVGKMFQRFFYADYFIPKSDFMWDFKYPGCRGYKTVSLEELDVQAAFGCSWEEIARNSPDTIEKLPFKTAPYQWIPEAAFLALARFERSPGYTEDHGPERFEVLYAKCEAVAIFRATFNRFGVAPGCLAHIRPGLAFGGNFQGYCKVLNQVVSENPAGTPEFLLYDHLGADPGSGGCLPITSRYRTLEHWSRYHPDFGQGALYLARNTWTREEQDWARARGLEDHRRRRLEGR
jgi:hypothetical protein